MPSHSSQADEAALATERPEPADVGDPGQPADHGNVAVVPVAERLAGRPRTAAPDRLRRVRAALDPALGDTGRRLSGFQGWTAASPMTKTSGWPGTVRSPPTMIRPALSVSAPVAAATVRPNEDARTPAAHRTVRAAIVSSPPSDATRTSLVDVDDAGSGSDVDPQALQLALRRRRSVRRVRRQDPIQGLDEDDPCVAGSIDRKSCLSVSLAISPSAPASSTPVGPPPTMTNVIQARRARIRLALGGLEGDEDPSSDLGGIVDRLEAGSEGRPIVVAEVAVIGAPVATTSVS